MITRRCLRLTLTQTRRGCWICCLNQPLTTHACTLRAAHTWRRKKNQKAIVKLDAAQTALDGLDVVLAKGLLRKIDSSILGEAEAGRFDELLLAAEARALELEDIKKDLPDVPPVKNKKKRGPFRRR